ncbi:MAG: winged helix-turn-helix transcriptional regulator [archaeon]|nr:winged helix-turn-helix transcriptional regulator [archaeon]
MSTKEVFKNDLKKNQKIEISMDRLGIVEVKIIEYITEYLQGSRVFSINSILPYIYSQIEIDGVLTKREVVAGLYSLIEKKYVIKGSKITKDNILRNNTRKSIYNFICINPGVYNSLLFDILGISSNELVWHTSILEDFQLIRKKRFGRSLAYFDNNLSEKYDKECFYLRNKKTLDIINLLKQYTHKNGITQMEISKELKIAFGTVQNHLKKLKEINLINRITVESKVYFIIDKDRMKELDPIIG